MPPEILSGKSYDPKKSDIFSLGIILFIMMTKKVLFETSDLSDFKYSTYQKDKKRYWQRFKEKNPNFEID